MRSACRPLRARPADFRKQFGSAGAPRACGPYGDLCAQGPRISCPPGMLRQRPIRYVARADLSALGCALPRTRDCYPGVAEKRPGVAQERPGAPRSGPGARRSGSGTPRNSQGRPRNGQERPRSGPGPLHGPGGRFRDPRACQPQRENACEIAENAARPHGRGLRTPQESVGTDSSPTD